MTKIIQVDAFTSEPFRGNPAGVCVLDGEKDDRWMQNVAAEMNLAETAFLRTRSDGAFDLRWFTPSTEVDLCGHATLASAHVLWESGRLPPETAAKFHTKSGLLTASRRGDWIELDFPATPDETVEPPAGLYEALGASGGYVGRSRFDYIVELDSEDAVARLRPDFGGLAKIPTRGVIATARSVSPDFDFVCRFFAPAAGIDEDPVTGSAFSCLAPFWSRRLGRESFVARQISRRGGIVRVRLSGGRVLIAGQAVTVLRCELLA